MKCGNQSWRDPCSAIPGLAHQAGTGRCIGPREESRHLEAIRRSEVRPSPCQPGKGPFSHIWNFARETGLTEKENPCVGIKGFREEGRDAFLDDALMAKLLAVSGKSLQFPLHLAHLTAQRPADDYKMSETDIRDGLLHVLQGKKKATIRIQVETVLKVLLAEIVEYKR